MRNTILFILCIIVATSVWANDLTADTFGSGENQFNIDFVTIPGDNGDLGDWTCAYQSFSGVNHGNYRMGVYEITNSQWTKFKANIGMSVIGYPAHVYDEDSYWTGEQIPANNINWVEAAQFVNWLNTSQGYHPAYNFTGTHGTADYTFVGQWDEAEAAEGTNRVRHKDAYYFLPSFDEWVKAAYWNGSSLQYYSTCGNILPVPGVDSNYGQSWLNPSGPWDVGSGSMELNGTYDMTGNLWEYCDDLRFDGFDPDIYSSPQVLYGTGADYCENAGPACRSDWIFQYDDESFGFRVASVPEPCSVLLLGLGGLALRKRRKA